jgi:predicted nucleic acid-binding protein
MLIKGETIWLYNVVNMTKIYFDTCCINRPFDDQTQVRIRLEAEAVLGILSRVESGEWEWIGSEVLMDEIEQMPDMQRLSRVKLLSSFAQEIVEINEKEVERAKELQKEGFQVFDALHIACAESAKADVFLSTDDRLLKQAQRVSKSLHVKVENPLTWVEEMMK